MVDNVGEIGGGVYGHFSIERSLIARNSLLDTGHAGYAGGLSGFGTVRDSAVVDNLGAGSPSTGNLAGGIAVLPDGTTGPDLVLDNSTVSGNRGGLVGGVLGDTGEEDGLTVPTGVDLVITASTVAGDEATGGAGASEIRFDPGFARPSLPGRCRWVRRWWGMGRGRLRCVMWLGRRWCRWGTASVRMGRVGWVAVWVMWWPVVILVCRSWVFNGGSTPSRVPVVGSVLIDAVPASVGSCGGVDQRGVVRPQGAGCDIGAVESDGPASRRARRLWG